MGLVHETRPYERDGTSYTNKVHQSRKFQFPQREFGKTFIVKPALRVRVRFQQQWFDRWPWLYYDEDQDLAF